MLTSAAPQVRPPSLELVTVSSQPAPKLVTAGLGQPALPGAPMLGASPKPLTHRRLHALGNSCMGHQLRLWVTRVVNLLFVCCTSPW